MTATAGLALDRTVEVGGAASCLGRICDCIFSVRVTSAKAVVGTAPTANATTAMVNFLAILKTPPKYDQIVIQFGRAVLANSTAFGSKAANFNSVAKMSPALLIAEGAFDFVLGSHTP